MIECFDSIAFRSLASKIKKTIGNDQQQTKNDIFLGIVKINLSSLIERANDYDRNAFEVKDVYPFVQVKASDKVRGNFHMKLKFEKIHSQSTSNTNSNEEEQRTIGHCGNISRDKAEELLLGKPVGTFLMRFSSSAQSHVLSYVRPDHRIGHIAHIKEKSDNSVEVVTEKGIEQFKNLHDFIATMKKNRVIFDPVEDHKYGLTQ